MPTDGSDEDAGVPLICLIHFRGTMDYWDPLFVNSLAATRPVILFDNAGVGKSTREIANMHKGMAQHILDFLSLLELKAADVLGFCMGGIIAQLVVLNAPEGLIRRVVLAGTGTSVGEGIISHSQKWQAEFVKHAGQAECTYDNCFYQRLFHPSKTSQEAGQAWWKRPRISPMVVLASRPWVLQRLR